MGKDERRDEVVLERTLGPLVRLVALVGGYGVLALAFFVAAEVVLRRAFAVSLQGADEYGGYALAALAAFGFAYAMMERSHTRIEILLEKLPDALRIVLDLVSVLAMAALAVFLAWRGYATLAESIEFRSLSGQPSMTPLWKPQAVWVAGLVFFAAFACLSALHALYLAVREPSAVMRVYGARTLEEEIDEERRSVETRGGVS